MRNKVIQAQSKSIHWQHVQLCAGVALRVTDNVCTIMQHRRSGKIDMLSYVPTKYNCAKRPPLRPGYYMVRLLNTNHWFRAYWDLSAWRYSATSSIDAYMHKNEKNFIWFGMNAKMARACGTYTK